MWRFESTHISPYIREKTIINLRYINDLFLIRKGKEEEILSFIEDPNKKHPFIEFNFKYSKADIEFLDNKIYRDTKGKLCLTIYRKPRNRQNYLHFKSVHPPYFKKSILYSKTVCIPKHLYWNWLSNKTSRRTKGSFLKAWLPRNIKSR